MTKYVYILLIAFSLQILYSMCSPTADPDFEDFVSAGTLNNNIN